MNNNNFKAFERSSRQVVISVVVVVLSVILVYALNFYNRPISASTSDWGSFGDYFTGVINGILSPVTLILVWLTYMSQKEELKKQREINEAQMKIMAQQSFEQTFFSLTANLRRELNYFSDTQKGVYSNLIEEIRRPVRGLDEYFRLDFNREDRTYSNDEMLLLMLRKFERFYWEPYHKHQSAIHYLTENVLHIIEWIDGAQNFPTTPEDKSKYLKILKVQLKSEELTVIALDITIGVSESYRELLTGYNFITDIHTLSLPDNLQAVINAKLDGKIN